MLNEYIGQVELADASNREGHAAKVYFNALFGMDFTRSADIPVNAALNYGYTNINDSRKRDYRCFRKLLIKNGFIMLQESVYCKMITSPSVENSVKNLIYKNKPAEGLVQILTITEKQFVKMDYVVGENTSNVIDSEERGHFMKLAIPLVDLVIV